MAISVLGNVTYINQNAQNATPPVRPDLSNLNIDEFVKKSNPEEVKIAEKGERADLDPNRNGNSQESLQQRQKNSDLNGDSENREEVYVSDHILDILA